MKLAGEITKKNGYWLARIVTDTEEGFTAASETGHVWRGLDGTRVDYGIETWLRDRFEERKIRKALDLDSKEVTP